MSAARLLLILVLTVGSLSACRPRATPDRTTVTDSAGVFVVASRGPDALETLTSIGVPEVAIGDDGSELNRVIGAVRLSDGRIVIGDGGNSVVQYYSSDGTLLGAVGREGDGPSEFRTLQAIGKARGDTVWAYDFSHHRVTFISPEGTVAREVSLHPSLTSALAVGVVPDGTIILGESWSSRRLAESIEPGLSREPVAYLRYASTGELIDTIGLFPGREVLLSFEDGRGVMGAAPMARASVHATTGPWLAIGDQVTHEIRLFSPSGTLERKLGWLPSPGRIEQGWSVSWLSRSCLLSDPPTGASSGRRQAGYGWPTTHSTARPRARGRCSMRTVGGRSRSRCLRGSGPSRLAWVGSSASRATNSMWSGSNFVQRIGETDAP